MSQAVAVVAPVAPVVTVNHSLACTTATTAESEGTELLTVGGLGVTKHGQPEAAVAPNTPTLTRLVATRIWILVERTVAVVLPAWAVTLRQISHPLRLLIRDQAEAAYTLPALASVTPRRALTAWSSSVMRLRR